MKKIKNKQLLLNPIVWVLSGVVSAFLAAGVVALSFFNWMKNNKFLELFLGLWIVLIFSDSAISYFGFAEIIKPVVLLILSFVVFSKSNSVSLTKFFYGFLPFILFCTLTSLINIPTFLISFQKIVSYLLLLIVVPSFIQYLRFQDEERAFKTLLYTGYSILFASILLMLLMPALGARFGGRLNGIFRNPNGIGMFTSLFGMLSLVILHYKPELLNKKEKIIAFILVMLALGLCQSRNAMVSLFIFFLLSRLNKGSNLIGVVSIFLLLVIGGWVYVNLEFIVISLGLEEFFRLDTLDEASGRIFVWEAAWAEITNRFFWVGEGFAYSEVTHWMDKYYNEFPDLIYHQGNIHNSYLTFWMNTGLIGVLLFFLPLIGYFIIAMQKSHFALPLLIAAGFLAFFESWLVASLNPFTIQFYMILTLLLQGKNFVEYKNDDPINDESKQLMKV